MNGNYLTSTRHHHLTNETSNERAAGAGQQGQDSRGKATGLETRLEPLVVY
jgi:hypothetical protein